MSSRFFNFYYSTDSDEEDYGSSASSSGSSDFSESEDEQVEVQQQQPQASHFQRGRYDSDSDSSSDEGRKVKSGKDKLRDKLMSIATLLGDASFVVVQGGYDQLTKLKLASLNELPASFVKTIVELSVALQTKPEDLSNLEAKAFNALKQKFRKLPDVLSSAIETFNANPAFFKDDSATKDEESDDDSMFGDDSSSSSSSDDEIDPNLTGRNRWLKKVKPEKSDKPKTAKPQKPRAQQTRTKETTMDGATKVSFAPVLDLTQESFYSRLTAVLEARGKKGTDKNQQIIVLRQLYDVANSPYQRIRVLLALIPAEFDVSSTSLYITGNLSKDIANDISTLLNLMESNSNIKVEDTVSQLDSDLDNERKLKNGETVQLLGNVGSFVDRLDQEFSKSLLAIEPSSTDYIDRLKSETELYAMIIRALKYYKECQNENAVALIASCRLEHIYYKPLSVIRALEDNVASAYPSLAPLLKSENTVEEVCRECYSLPHERTKTKAVLCQIYHYAMHDAFSKARDLVLLSHLQETISTMEVPYQVLYNRAMAQYAICAFRHGYMRECMYAAHDLFANNRPRELLSQSKPSLVPFHMHIDMDLLECIFYTASLFVELPNMHVHLYDSKKWVLSKSFRRLWDYVERASFVGPPEGFKDRIVCAGKNMARGDWRLAAENLSDISLWNCMSDKSKILEMITEKAKIESLRCYVLASTAQYSHISIPRMARLFELEKFKVTSLFTEMIYEKQLYALIDGDVLEFDQEALTKMDYLGSVFVEKETILREYIEKMNDISKKIKKQKK